MGSPLVVGVALNINFFEVSHYLAISLRAPISGKMSDFIFEFKFL